jgi:hypothetical protein
MPGSYAHLTMVGIARTRSELLAIDGFPREAVDAAGFYLKFLELGAVSPDYPYLDVTSGEAKKWADVMHYTHTGDTVYTAATMVRDLPSGEDKDKCLAWLMGFVAHVVGDMCIHPVVYLKVGPYDQNATPHRRCEMHQDAFIFPRLGLGMPQTSEHIKSTIMKCGTNQEPHKIDPAVKNLLDNLLRTIHADLFASDPPDINNWHDKCYMILEQLLPTSSRLVPFARHVCNGIGLVYPETDRIDMGYIKNLRVPAADGIDQRKDYDEIFDFTIQRIREAWRDVARHALGIEDLLSFRGGEWNLDTGRDLAAADKLVFWEVA